MPEFRRYEEGKVLGAVSEVLMRTCPRLKEDPGSL